MNVLILDSSTNVLYTALLINDKVIYETYIKGKNDHARAILTEVEKACSVGGIDLIELNKVIVGIGPGSYTGVRMSVTVGKMLATMEKHIALYMVSTLVLMASGYKGKVLSSIDARRGNCFGCIYDTTAKTFVVEESLIEKEALMQNAYDFSVDENEFKVDPYFVLKEAIRVEEPRTLVPNYLRETEAERNLNDKKI